MAPAEGPRAGPAPENPAAPDRGPQNPAHLIASGPIHRTVEDVVELVQLSRVDNRGRVGVHGRRIK